MRTAPTTVIRRHRAPRYSTAGLTTTMSVITRIHDNFYNDIVSVCYFPFPCGLLPLPYSSFRIGRPAIIAVRNRSSRDARLARRITRETNNTRIIDKTLLHDKKSIHRKSPPSSLVYNLSLFNLVVIKLFVRSWFFFFLFFSHIYIYRYFRFFLVPPADNVIHANSAEFLALPPAPPIHTHPSVFYIS